jgi:SOS-response transcriptional repressor LexA
MYLLLYPISGALSSQLRETRSNLWYHLSTNLRAVPHGNGENMSPKPRNSNTGLTEDKDKFVPNVGAKLKLLLAERGFSQRELARRADLSLTIINSMATGKYPPGTAIASFERVAAALGTSVAELFGGAQPVADPAEELALLRALHSGDAPGLHRIAARLDQLLARADQVETARDEGRPHLAVLGGEDQTLLVPLYGHAAAGLGAYNEPQPAWADVEKVPVPRTLRVSDGQLIATRVRGESMEPELSDGDTVVVHYPERQPALQLLEPGQLVAVTTMDGGEWSDYLKRYRLNPETGEELLVSTNADFAPIPIRPKDVRFVGKVKMILRG